MQIHFSYQGVGDEDKLKLENYAGEEKFQNLTKLIQHGDRDLSDLDIRVEYRAHHNNFSVKIDFKIPRHILVSEETSYNLTESFDLALGKILEQLRKVESKIHDKQ
jgi:ribosome-associated translation inhibitor RaiA